MQQMWHVNAHLHIYICRWCFPFPNKIGIGDKQRGNSKMSWAAQKTSHAHKHSPSLLQGHGSGLQDTHGLGGRALHKP